MEKIKLEHILENKQELGIFPTPLYRISNTEKLLDYGPIYIKRDDLTGLGPGGNKTRSLEYILADAIREKSNVIIASGPLQSNLCTLTACACNKLGLHCALVHNSIEPEKYEGNVLLNMLLDVETHFIGDAEENERSSFVNELYKKYKEDGKRPYIIKNGASTGYGALGYVNAIKELMKQCRETNLEINEIFAPGGNGGVAAGLIYGNSVFGLPFKVNIISVEYDRATLYEKIEKIIKEIEQITQIPFNNEIEECCSIIDSYRGKGWGESTKDSKKLVFDFPKSEGIFIENVYNSKVLVGLFDMIKKGEVNGSVCYLHTGGFGSLFSQF